MIRLMLCKICLVMANKIGEGDVSSGYFPLDGSNSKELKEVIEKLNSIRLKYQDWSIELDCSEDALSDGGYLEKMSIAIQFLEECVD